MKKQRYALVMLTVLVVFMGCAALQQNKDNKDSKSASASNSASAPASNSNSLFSSIFKPNETPPTPLYLDFGDILIPSELEIEKNSTFIMKSSGVTAGVMSLNGRVEINSLISFFSSNMSKDNWKEAAAFKSPRSMMLYQKDNRWCVINITTGQYYTHVEIWVAPKSSGMFEYKESKDVKDVKEPRELQDLKETKESNLLK